MRERKVYRLSTGMERQCITEDSEVRLYLSEVRSKKKKRKTFSDKAVMLFLKLFYSFAVSYFVGMWAIDYAYKERGYVAYGGEYLLILMVFYISFWAIDKFLERR